MRSTEAIEPYTPSFYVRWTILLQQELGLTGTDSTPVPLQMSLAFAILEESVVARTMLDSYCVSSTVVLSLFNAMIL